jgi:hypothetical protein
MHLSGYENIAGAPGNMAGFQIAGNPSFDINPGAAGDKRQQRKGLSQQDVDRLKQANPDFADQIDKMYLPGPSLPLADASVYQLPIMTINGMQAIGNVGAIDPPFFGFQNKFVS